MALIRCKSCNNPISSRLATCPFCGAAVADSLEAGQPTTPVVSTINDASAAPRKTLNDILAERQTKSATINELHTAPETVVPSPRVVEPAPKPQARPVEKRVVEPQSQPKAEPKPQPKPASQPAPQPGPASQSQPKVEPKTESRSVAAEKSQSSYSGDYDRDERLLDDYEAEITRYKRSSSGFLIVAIVLLIALIPLTIFAVKNYGKVKTIERDYALVESARRLFEEQNTMLQRDAESLVKELERFKGKNDTMMQKYQEAVEMLEQMQREKAYSYSQLAKYRREVDVLKGVMKGYIRKIDSLNDINTDLQAKNVAYERERADYQERAERAEEQADELNRKVRIGSVIRTGGVRLVALNDNDKPVKRVKVATSLRVDFELTANELAEPGEKTIYVCITDPEGYVLPPKTANSFVCDGVSRTASAVRKVSYENESVPVSVYYKNAAFDAGTYKVEIYIDGRYCGGGSTHFE